MKNILIFIISILLSICELQAQPQVAIDEFQAKLGSSKDAQLIDVRTAKEYNEGHLQRALNIDYRSPEFREAIKVLNKKEPVFVYCLAGSRSAAASEILRNSGFTEVYDMKGGYLKWNAAGMPVDKVIDYPHPGMTLKEYMAIIGSSGIVLIDFHAAWCSPCVKMMPTIKKLTAEYKNKARIETISYDAHKSLAKELGVEEIPVFLLYKNGKLISRKNGYQEEADFRRLLTSGQ